MNEMTTTTTTTTTFTSSSNVDSIVGASMPPKPGQSQHRDNDDDDATDSSSSSSSATNADNEVHCHGEQEQEVNELENINGNADPHHGDGIVESHNGSGNHDDNDDFKNGHFLETRGGAISSNTSPQQQQQQYQNVVDDGDDDIDNSNSNSNINLKRFSPRKARRPPQRFVARASKQGWSVEDGDRAFLENDARYYNNHSNSLSTTTTTATATTTTETINDSTDTALTAPVSAFATTSRTTFTSNNKNNHHHANKSILQNVPSSAASKKTPPKMTVSSSAAASIRAAAPSLWTCHKCTTTNGVSRLRCLACQGWKGGHREGYSHPTKTTTPTATVTTTSSLSSLPRTKSTTAAKHERQWNGGGAIGTSGGGGIAPRAKRMKVEETAATSSSTTTIRTHHSNATTTETATSKRKSAISRRPRQLRPTEKMIAFRNSIEEEKLVKSNHFYQQQQRQQQRKRKADDDIELSKDANSGNNDKIMSRVRQSSATAINSTTPTSSWQCSRCSTINLTTKSRCSSCQGWRGGKREGLPKSNGRKENSTGRQQHHSPLEEGEKTKKMIANTSVSASVATTAIIDTTSGHHGNSVIPTSVAVGGGGECIDKEEDASSESFDDVVCCLCKCAVDFSDRDYFLPPHTTKVGMNSIVNGVDDSTREELRGKMNGDAGSMELLRRKSSSASAVAPSSSFEVHDAKLNGTEQSEEGSYFAVENSGQSCEQIKPSCTTDGRPDIPNEKQLGNEQDSDDDESMPSFQLPYRFYDPTNALILCDGPAYAKKNKRQEYKCERAYHQHCHFVPVLSIPRGPWRCLICKYHDEMYLKEKASKKNGSSGHEELDEVGSMKISNMELNAIFRCHPVYSTTFTSSVLKDETVKDENEFAMKGLPVTVTEGTGDVNANSRGTVFVNEARPAKQQLTQCPSVPDNVQLEQRFEMISSPLKAHLLHTELTTRSRTVIKSSLATIRNAEHSLRSITETGKARKALAERVESDGLGLPQELCQSVMRIALCKTRIREVIFSLENVIRSRPAHHDVLRVPKIVDLKSSIERDDEEHDMILNAPTDDNARNDHISDLMQWYLLQPGCDARTTNAQVNGIAPVITNATIITGETTKDNGKSLLHHLFPQGNISYRRSEPRTGEAHIHSVKNHANEDGEGNSVTSISLDDLVCWTCHGTDASDENDMLLCDGMGCCRAFHMKCLEPKLSLDDVHKSADENWFCPLCTAHATLIHYAQSEYFGDELEESPLSPLKRVKDNGRLGLGSRINSEWETAKDAFAEAPFELRIAQKLKENIRDEETAQFLAEELGIVTHFYSSSLERGEPREVDAINNFNFDWEDDGSDDDFDNDENELFDDDSLKEEVKLEMRLAKEKIGREELDALSVTSDVEDTFDSSSANADGTSHINSNKKRPRRSKRRRTTVPEESKITSNDYNDESINGVRSSDLGTLDVANIVRGKRSRTKVDYRKLADAMFGDESDEDAKGPKGEYTFIPKKKNARKNKNDSDGDVDSSEDVSDNDCADIFKT